MKLGYILGMGGLGGIRSSLLVGLEHYWKLDEVSGTRNDSVGSAHLTDNNTVGSVLPVTSYSKAAYFTRANQEFLSKSNPTTIMPATGNPWTISFWIGAVAVGSAYLTDCIYSGNSGFYFISNAAGNIDFGVGNGTNFTSAAAQANPLNGVWHHVFAWWDDADQKCHYQVDAGTVRDSATTFTYTAAPAAALFRIGGIASISNGPNGPMAQYGVWNRVLTSGERASIYNSGSGKLLADFTAGELNGLTHYWKLDEASGDRADSVGSVTLTDNNTVTAVDVKNGNAASFVAANSESLSIAHASATDLSAASLGPTGFTLSAWLNLFAATGSPNFITKDGATREWMLNVSAGKLYFLMYNELAATFALTTTTTVFTGAGWKHVVLTWDPSDRKGRIYVNNTLEVTTAALASTGYSAATNPFKIGIGRDSGLDAKVDEVGIWSRVLTSDERAALYNAGAGKFYPAF